MNFLYQKTAKTWANAVLNWGGIKLQRSSDWTLANPGIPRKIVKAKRDTRSSKWQKVLFYFTLPKGIALEAIWQLSIISISHCPRKEKREWDRRITAQRISIHCPGALHSRNMARAPKPAQECAWVQVGGAVTAALPLPKDATDKAHDNPQSQQTFSQHRVTSHKPHNATEGMTRHILFRQQTVTLKPTKKTHAPPHPLSIPQRAAVQSSSIESVFSSIYEKKQRL